MHREMSMQSRYPALCHPPCCPFQLSSPHRTSLPRACPYRSTAILVALITYGKMARMSFLKIEQNPKSNEEPVLGGVPFLQVSSHPR